MPYITADRRQLLNVSKDVLADNAGELNFQITMLCKKYLSAKGVKYQQCNDVIGALEGAKLEFYRRVVAPYEDQKIKSNGDVY